MPLRFEPVPWPGRRSGALLPKEGMTCSIGAKDQGAKEPPVFMGRIWRVPGPIRPFLRGRR